MLSSPGTTRNGPTVKTLFPSFFLMLANATDRELARQVQYLKTENRILRDKLPKRLTVTVQERQRLLKFGKPLGKALRDLIIIVSPRTFARWLNGESATAKSGKDNKSVRAGRPKTPEDIRQWILRLACENAWGYTRVLGELKKLGVGNIKMYSPPEEYNELLVLFLEHFLKGDRTAAPKAKR